MPKVSISKRSDREVVVRPEGYFERPEFQAYLAACRESAAHYVQDLRAQVAGVQNLAVLISALKKSGFVVSIEDVLRKKLEDSVGELETASETNDAIFACVEAYLTDRDLRLYPFQKIGVRWLAPKTKALLADDMGIGKTVQALAALPMELVPVTDDGGEEETFVAPVLVVAPAGVKGVWKREAARWRDDYIVTVLKGRDSFRWPRYGEIVVTNYDVLPDVVTFSKNARPKLSEYAVDCPGELLEGTIAIGDEIHLVKNSKAKRTLKFRVIASHVRDAGGKVWGLTGTPLLNKPPELWAVLSALDLAFDCFGSYKSFCRLFNAGYGSYGTEWGTPSDEVPKLLKRVSLHRRKRDVLPDLPAKTYRTIPVNGMDEATKLLCDEFVAKLRAAGVAIEDLDAAKRTTEVQAVIFEMLSKVRAALATSKIPALLELVETYETSETPLIVCSSHRKPIDTLAKRKGWARISGSESAEKRTEIENDFQAGKYRGLAMTTRAGGIGLTLTHASEMIFVDLDWTPALNAQAEDRICRIGQDRGVNVTRLVSDHPVDERVCELLSKKQALISATIEASARGADEEIPDETTVTKDALDVETHTTESARAESEPKTTKLSLVLPNETFEKEIPARGAYGKNRPPKDDVERHAAIAMIYLADDDPDFATVRNDVGFSKFDAEFGHSLAGQISKYGRLSERQWSAATRLAYKYRRQVGTTPEVDALPF